MTNEERRREWEKARALGEQARRGGKKLSDNPFKGDYRGEAWENGFSSQCERMGRESRSIG